MRNTWRLAILAALVGALQIAAGDPVELAAEELAGCAEPHGGDLFIVHPPQDRLRIQGDGLLLYKPGAGEQTLGLRVPVLEPGYYRVGASLVCGPWQEGRYGAYGAWADGVRLDTPTQRYYHGWYDSKTQPHYKLQWRDWGVIYMRGPDMDLAFRREPRTRGDLLGIERLRLDPTRREDLPAEQLARADRTRQGRETKTGPGETPEPALMLVADAGTPSPGSRSDGEKVEEWPVCVVDGVQPLTWVTVVQAPRKPVQVDGDLSEWDFSRPVIEVNAATIKGRGYGAPAPDGDADMSATCQLAWDETNLYFAARVRDDMRAGKRDDTWSSYWSHDGIVFLSQFPAWLTSRSVNGKGKSLTVGFNYYSAGGSPRKLPDGVDYRAVDSPEGYVIEAVIPFAALGFTPRVHDRLPFSLIAVDIDPDKPAGRRFTQYLWNMRGARRGEMRLADARGWSGALTPERDSYDRGGRLRYVGVIDVFDAPAALKSIEIVDALSGKVVDRRAVSLQLPANQRARVRGEIKLPAMLAGRYEVRPEVGR